MHKHHNTNHNSSMGVIQVAEDLLANNHNINLSFNLSFNSNRRRRSSSSN